MSPFELIFKIGSRIRNPSLYKNLSFIINAQRWDLDRLIDHQIIQLNKLLKFADNHSLFYKSYFNKHGFNTTIKSLDDLKNLPPISKNDLLDENENIHTNYNFNKTFFSETSGSTGQVLTFRKNEEWDSQNRASIIRSYNWHDVKPWEKNIYFWGYNIDLLKRKKIRVMDFLQNRYRIFDYNSKSLSYLINKMGSVSYIHGYSSVIYELSKIFKDLETDLDFSKLKMIKGTSEKIFSHYNKDVSKVFGKKIISEYGAAETGVIAFECFYGNMHINMENVIVEEIDNEIIITNLLSYSFPVIRYKLGDSIKLSSNNKVCECGMQHKIIEEIHGRIGKNIYGYTKKYPSLTLYYIFKNIFFDHGLKINYQCIQKEKYKLLVLIKEEYSERLKRKIVDEFSKYFDNDIIINIKFSQSFHTFQSKLVDFISEVDED